MGEVLRGGEEKEGYRSIQSRRTADLIIVHHHIYRHCPQKLSVQSTGGAPGTEGVQAQTILHPFSLLFLSGPPSSGVGMAVEGTQPQKPLGFLQPGHQSQCPTSSAAQLLCSAELPIPVLRNKGHPHKQHCPPELPPLALQQGH